MTGRYRIYVAVDTSTGTALGHIELSNIIPFLSAFVSRVLVGELSLRGHGIGRRMVALLARHAFGKYGLHWLNLGVQADNSAAIRGFERVGFKYVDTWGRGLKQGQGDLTLNWMTLFRSDLEAAEIAIANS